MVADGRPHGRLWPFVEIYQFLSVPASSPGFSSKPERIWLRTWQFWAGGAIACLLFLPVVLANAATGFDALAYQGSRTIGHDFNGLGFVGNFGEFLGGQAFVALPGTLVLIAIALFRRRLLPEGRSRDALDLLFLTSMLPVLYFVFHAFHSRVRLIG